MRTFWQSNFAKSFYFLLKNLLSYIKPFICPRGIQTIWFNCTFSSRICFWELKILEYFNITLNFCGVIFPMLNSAWHLSICSASTPALLCWVPTWADWYCAVTAGINGLSGLSPPPYFTQWRWRNCFKFWWNLRWWQHQIVPRKARDVFKWA